MKHLLILLFTAILLSCNNETKGPDVSAIAVNVDFKRFDQDFFSIDSNQTKQGLAGLAVKYPNFLPLFVGNVLGLGAITDTNDLAFEGTKRFLHLNKRIFDTAKIVFNNTGAAEKELTKGFQHVKFYFPSYQIPKTIYTVIGPMDALAPMSNQEPSPNFMGDDFLAISLQFYLGKEFSIYNDAGYISSVVPQFRSRRFSKEYIAPDVFSLVIDDLFPDSSNRQALIERFIEKGKRLYLLQKFLPNTNDTLLIGYTGNQLTWCRQEERNIYNFFIQQNLLFEIDPSLLKNYISEAPTTQGMPPESPGNIGAFLGWQIVKAYVNKKKDISPEALMKINNRELFNQSGYKPR